MKTYTLLAGLLLPLAAVGQKIRATHEAITYTAREKTPLYRAAADTASKSNYLSGYFLPVGSEIAVVGDYSPRWLVVKRQGFLYLASTSQLTPPASISRSKAADAYLASVAAEDKEEAAKVDGKNGFREYHLGDEITKHPDLIKIEGSGRDLVYRRLDENLKIGEADLKDISYIFYKGRLSSILIQIKGSINSNKVLEALLAQYGNGFKNQGKNQRYWRGQRASILYDENTITHDAVVSFSSQELAKQKAEDDKEVAKKATSDL